MNSGSLSDGELSQLQDALARSGGTGLMARALAAERGLFIPCFRLTWAEFERLTQLGESDAEGTGHAPQSGSWYRLLRKIGFFERDLNFYLRAMETNISLASLPAPQNLAVTNAIEAQSLEAKRRLCLMSGFVMPPLKAVVREAEGIARLRTAQAALAVERFHLAQGRWPAKLGELVPQYLSEVPVDPFDGQAIRYRLLPKGYVVYSVGSDHRDDGGREPPERKKSTDTSTYDVTFTVER